MKFIISILFAISFNVTADTKSSTEDYIYILGVAQDAGYPQAGCFRPHCMKGWQDKSKRLTATSIAYVSKHGNFLFEATPHFPDQLFRLRRQTGTPKLSGIFLTHAHIGHYTGLMHLGHEVMGAKSLPVYAMPRMKKYLETNGPWSQLVTKNNIALKPLAHNKPVKLSSSLTVTPIQVPHRDEFSETVGYHIQGPRKSALFIPDINKWNVWKRDIRAEIKKVDYALVDATFFSGDELPGRDMSKIPHPSVTESMALFDKLPMKDRNRVWFIHMNHSNPLLDANSKATKQVLKAGYNIAREGMQLGM